jgi:DnaJ-class molecular chaperone
MFDKQVLIRDRCGACDASGRKEGWQETPCPKCAGEGWTQRWVTLEWLADELRYLLND